MLIDVCEARGQAHNKQHNVSDDNRHRQSQNNSDNDQQNPIKIYGDPDAIARLAAAAFENAAEAGAKNIRVRVMAGGRVVIAVIEDDGAGCDTEQLPQLSKTFFTTKTDAPSSSNIGNDDDNCGDDNYDNDSDDNTSSIFGDDDGRDNSNDNNHDDDDNTSSTHVSNINNINTISTHGLGLPLIRSIVCAHDGAMSAYAKNVLGGGAGGLSLQFTFAAEKGANHRAAASEVMFVRKGFTPADEAAVMRVLKNLRVTPHVANTFAEAEEFLRVRDDAANPAFGLVVLCSPAAVAEGGGGG